MERKYIFNINELNNYLDEQQKNPDWVDWELTILRNNCMNNIFEILEMPKECTITINEDNWEVKINNQSNLWEKFYLMPSWFEIDKKDWVYRQVKFAMDEAKNRWIFDHIFKEIKVE